MEWLLRIWEEHAGFKEIAESISGGETTAVCGLDENARDFLIGAIHALTGRRVFLVTYSMERSCQAKKNLDTWIGPGQVGILPPEDVLPFETVAMSNEARHQRASALFGFAITRSLEAVIAPITALLRKASPPEDLRRCSATLSPGLEMSPEAMGMLLIRAGYKEAELVRGEGEWSKRGGVIAVYPVGRDFPLRVEFCGNTIESVREFEPDSQRSVREIIEPVMLAPAAEFMIPCGGIETAFDGPQLACAHLERITAYIPEDAVVVLDEPARIREAGESVWNDFEERVKHGILQGVALPSHVELYERPDTIWKDLVPGSLVVSLMPIEREIAGNGRVVHIVSRPVTPLKGQWAIIEKEFKRRAKLGQRIVIFADTVRKKDGLSQMLEERGVKVREAGTRRPPDGVEMEVGHLPGGFEIPEMSLIVLSEAEITGRVAKPARHGPKRPSQVLSAYRELRPGDYVVHAQHGIGKYMGMKMMEIDGARRDYLFIQYAGEDKLYVPTDQIHLIQKYVGVEGCEPRLNKLGGAEWVRTKHKVKESVREMARELLELYAVRKTSSGYAFREDQPWQREFEDLFAFEETPDQRRATEEIKRDMEKPVPMDRLLCGDVGYGKTEVAMRAAFKSVLDGKQVAVLVPTTILAYQHYSTFRERFGGYPVTVDMLSRFRTAAEQQAIIERLEEGTLDIVIGTHRLLQDDIKFKDLGLLIIDEEQRFGVAQKEKLKRLRQNVDVLTLSATPIPRTLQMSLVGIRDMSLIETPPEERYPVQTYVLEYNENVIREAIRRELARNGQVYYVHNRVETIDDALRRLRRIVPGARIGVAHGQMGDDELEKVMLGFFQKDYEILLCTAIIESGLDIANVNTLIVEDCDRFGLSQLYQLRGRVGRSNRVAYAYFTYRRDKVLSEPAEKRLQAIREFTELGSGFRIALRDLEIRGAGNLLGPEQHGFIASVGFSMYVDLLEQAISELKSGQPVKKETVPTSVEVPMDAFVPKSYVPDELQRVEIYKRAADLEDPRQIADLEDELRDRFGPVPEPARRFLKIAQLRAIASRLGISSIRLGKSNIVVKFSEETPMSAETLIDWAKGYEGKLRFQVGKGTSIIIHSPGKSMSRRIASLERILTLWGRLKHDSSDGGSLLTDPVSQRHGRASGPGEE